MRNFKLNTLAALITPAALILTVGLPMQASERDNKIESTAKNSYNFKTYLKDDAIKIESNDGVVTLTGTVSQDYHKFLAQETVSDMPGVKSVDNKLVVIGDQPSEKSDAWITMKVKTALTFHQNVSASATEVTTQGGMVTLTGKADSEAQKQLTGEYAKDVEGVTMVHNELIVSKPEKHHESMGQKVDDSSITAQIKTTLLFHKSTHALATKVITRNGMVTVRGVAKSEAERDLVTKFAEDVSGVKHVRNQMTVKNS